MQITLPDLGLSEQEIRQELALSLYQQRKVSLAKAASLAEMTRIEFQHLMASRDIYMHGDVVEYDYQTLRQLGQIP